MPHMPISELDDKGNLKEAITVEITEEEIKELRIGQKIEVTITGSVGMLQVPSDGSSKEEPPLLGIRVTGKKVEGLNAFAELARDDDED